MNKRVKLFAAVCVAIVILGLYILSIPQERLLYSEEDTNLEFYPNYNYANFTVASSDTNAELSFEIDIDFGENYTNYNIFWLLYHLTPEQFEAVFNITEVHDIFSEDNWDNEDFDALWAGWSYSSPSFLISGNVPSGPYVLVFWIEPEGPTTGWSFTLTVYLRTSILPRI